MLNKFILFSLLQLVIVSTTLAQYNDLSSDEIIDKLKENGNPQKAAITFLSNRENKITPDIIHAIHKEIANKKSTEYPELCFWMGKHFHNENPQKSYYFFYKTLKSSPNLTDTTVPFLAEFNEKMGITYFYFKRYKESIQHLKKSLQFKNSPEGLKISCYNTLGLIYRNINNYTLSRYYTKKGYDLALQSNDRPWIGVLSGNLGFLVLREKKYEKARELLLMDFNISKETKQFESCFMALTELIHVNIELKEYDSIPKKIKLLTELNDSTHLLTSKYSFYEVMTDYMELIGNYKGAMTNYKLAKLYADSIADKQNALAIRNFEFQMDFEQKQAEVQVLNEKHKKDRFKLYVLIISFLLFGCVAAFTIRRILRKRREEREMQIQKQMLIEKELKKSEKELHQILDNLMKKNVVIDQLKNEIETINSDKISSIQQEKLLDSLQSFTLLTDEDWDTFKRLFEKLHPGFIGYFKVNYSEVTASETRLATLIKLNLSNLEIANALGISPDSVRKTSLRIRKKLNIGSNEELIKFILSILPMD